MPMELPHRGIVRGFGDVLLEERQRLRLGLFVGHVDCVDRVDQAGLGVHLGDEVTHLGHLLGRRVNHEVRTLGDDVEVVVGDQVSRSR